MAAPLPFVPHLDSAVVLDCVLRSPVVHGISEVVDGLSRPKIYGELSSRLFGVKSLTIHQYLVETFGQSG